MENNNVPVKYPPAGEHEYNWECRCSSCCQFENNLTAQVRDEKK